MESERTEISSLNNRALWEILGLICMILALHTSGVQELDEENLHFNLKTFEICTQEINERLRKDF